jgi:hypothetical protein
MTISNGNKINSNLVSDMPLACVAALEDGATGSSSSSITIPFRGSFLISS